MAFNDIEIEIKIQINENDFFQLHEFFDKAKDIVFCGVTEQIDTYFSSKNQQGYLGQEKYPYKWLSIRNRDNKTIVNYKHYFPEKSEKHEYCHEYEVEISSLDKMEKIFAEMTYSSVATVNKIRRKYLLNNDFEIVLDEIKNLGFFMEVEAIRDFGGISEARNAILDFIKSLPLKDYRIDYRGYPFLVYEKGIK